VPNVPVLALSVVGMAIAGYLTYTGWSGGLAAFCGPGEGCDIVQSSRWATFLGLPTAFWGLVTYAALAVVAWREPRAAVQWHWASLVAMAGWSVSVYLTGVSVFVLDATCPYCLASLGIFTAILGVLWWQRGAAAPGVGRRALVQAAALSVVVIAAMHLQSAGDATAPFVAAGDPVAAGEDAYLSGLASRLAASGAVFYGASWCPHCQDQKALFGASAGRLPYVECSTAGPGSPSTQACTDADVQVYPTWVFAGGDRAEGVQPLSELARRVGYEARSGG
jgi:uncharacterized membrane protein